MYPCSANYDPSPSARSLHLPPQDSDDLMMRERDHFDYSYAADESAGRAVVSHTHTHTHAFEHTDTHEVTTDRNTQTKTNTEILALHTCTVCKWRYTDKIKNKKNIGMHMHKQKH